MKFLFLKIAAVLTCLISIANAKSINVQFIHTNDIHSYFLPLNTKDNLGGVSRIKTKKEELEKKYNISFFVDGGDFSEGSFGFLAGEGSYSYQIMSKMNYDVMAFGNHDWLYGLNFVEKRLTQLKNQNSKLPMLCANLEYHYSDAEKNPLLDRIKVIDRGGLRVAFIGLSTDELFYQSYLAPHKMLSPIDRAKDLVAKVKKFYKPDMVVAVTHLGLVKDIEVAQKVPGIDLIVGGHCHTLLLEPKVAFNEVTKKIVPIVQVGEYGQYIGETILAFDDKLKTVRLKKYNVYPVSPEIKGDKEIEDLAIKAYTESFSYLEPRLTKVHKHEHDHEGSTINNLPGWEINGKVEGDLVLDMPIKKTAYGPSNLGNLVVDAFKSVLNADFAFYDTNTIGLTLPEGRPLLVSDLYNSLPFIYDFKKRRAWNVYLLDMTVGELNTILLAGLFLSPNVAIAGQSVVYDLQTYIIPYVQIASYNGNFVDYNSRITVATTEAFLAGINLMKKYAGNILDIKMNDTGYQAWDILGFYLQNRKDVAVREANKVRHRLVHKNEDVVPIAFDIKQDLSSLLNKKIKFSLPIVNLSKSKIKKGVNVYIYRSPHIGYQSKVDPYSSYELVYSKTIDIELKDRTKINLNIELEQQDINSFEQNNYQFLATRKYYVHVTAPDEKIPGNQLNNVQEFELTEY